LWEIKGKIMEEKGSPKGRDDVPGCLTQCLRDVVP